MERLVRDVDPALHVRATYSYATLVDRSLVTERIMAMLGGTFGLLALIVAGLGVLAFQVARRTNELGVRGSLFLFNNFRRSTTSVDAASVACGCVQVRRPTRQSIAEFARSKRDQYPEFADPVMFTKRLLTKYPSYRGEVDFREYTLTDVRVRRPRWAVGIAAAMIAAMAMLLHGTVSVVAWIAGGFTAQG